MGMSMYFLKFTLTVYVNIVYRKGYITVYNIGIMKRIVSCTNCKYEVSTKKQKGEIISCAGCKGKFVENEKGGE